MIPTTEQQRNYYSTLRTKIYTVLKEKLESQELVSEWLDSPHPAIRGRTPMDYMCDGDLISIEQILYLAEGLRATPGVGWQRP